MNGIILDPNLGDMTIRGCGCVIGGTEPQIIEQVLVANRGEFRESPLIGGELVKQLGCPGNRMWSNRVKTMLRVAGVSINNLIVDDNIITIE